MKEEQLVIDRFEGEYAVCEDESGKYHDYARVELPREAQEGDVLRRGGDGAWSVDRAATHARRERNRRLLASLYDDE